MADEQNPKPRRRPMYDLPIFENGYTSIPAFWVDELMPYANGIPASFWKYMMVIWCDVVGPNCETKGYRADKVMTQFHMTKETAMQWTAALDASGLFSIEYGFRYKSNVPGVPTKFKYLEKSTVEEWQCFITGLRNTILSSKSSNFKVQRDGIEGFRIAVSFDVDNERQRRGLPRVFDDWHKKLYDTGRLRRDENGRYQWDRSSTDRKRLSGKDDLEYIKSLERSLGVAVDDEG
jgi:hypothetical protein